MHSRWIATMPVCAALGIPAGVCRGADGPGPTPTKRDSVTTVRSWAFPHQTESAWFLGNTRSAWAVSKATGQVLGGWNAKTKERCLDSVEARYHLEDAASLVTGRESRDTVLRATFDDAKQRIELTCANPDVPDLAIGKRYRLDGNKLWKRVAFTTTSRSLQFVTYNTEAAFTPAYRDGSYYMGGGDGGGPLVPAPRITEWQKIVQYQNTPKGMLLHQPGKGYSFAHVRTRLDDSFVWPWFTGAIASYVEPVNIMHYTPDGWDMSLGTSRLSPTQETSYEQYLSIFEGDWQTFLQAEYPSLPEVRRALREIPPVPDWVDDVKIYTGSDMHRLRQMVKMTDEGTIMVMISLSGSWSDYYVDRGMEGGLGGFIKGEELREWIRRIKALSPRIKVGLYMWVLSVCENARIYKDHPEWFRYGNKDGEPLSTFPGFAANYAHLLSIPECYNELLRQFDLVLSYLDTDYIYLDDPKAINMIDWKSGEYTRDDLSFRFFLDIKRIAAKHGPDKVVFFNNRGNPYGDINFIEARAQLRANYWRQFAGIAAVTQQFVTATRPRARIAPLYYTPPLAREYLNRVLALGWIPSLTYCDVVGSRAFFQAAYEMGNCRSVPVRYSPDWKRDPATEVESYAVQRHGDDGYVLSFINHADGEGTVPVSIDLDSLDLDREGQVFVWGYTVADALECQGVATERLAREVYAQSGWQIDRVTRRRLLYAGPYRKQIELELPMAPLLLNQLYVTPRAATVYSEDNLPANYLFGRMPKVALHEEADWRKGSLTVQVDSDRDVAEIVLALPLASHRLRRLSLDGRAVEPALVCEGDDVLPVVKVGKGRHTLALTFTRDADAEAVAVAGFTAVESLNGMRIALPGFRRALLTLERDGRVLFNRMVTGTSGNLQLPLMPAREDAGRYTVALKAVVDDTGHIRPVQGVQAEVDLSCAIPDLNLGPEKPPWTAGRRGIAAVGRTIGGVDVLRSAVLTTPTLVGDAQPALESMMAEVDPDQLTLEAGTTRKVGERSLGAAFAGLEIRSLRKVKVRLANTFHSAFHMRGTGFHVPPKPNSRNFAGIVVDYHTPKGYAKRASFAVGVLHPKCSSRYPDYGRAAIADQFRDLGSALIEAPQATFSLDLQQFAPEGWDGRVWLSVGSDWVAPNRRLTLQVLAVNDAVSGDFLHGTDPAAFREAYEKPRVLRAPRSPGGINIDGSPDEEMWRGAAQTDQFFLHGGRGVSDAKTTAMLLYDDRDLYVAFTCAEPGRRKPLIVGGPPWDDDEVEVWIDVNGDGKTFRQVIVNAANERMEYGEAGRTPIGATTAVHVVEGHGWMVEMTIPLKGLGVAPPKPGDSWRLSLCRYRPPGKGFNSEMIVWAPLKSGGFKDLANFGTLIFE